MSERVYQTTCPGVAEVYDSPVRKKERKFLAMFESVPVTVTEGEYGEVGVLCPFYKDQECQRPFDLRLSIPLKFSVMPTICCFEPAASLEAPDIYTQPFIPENFHLSLWNSLSPEAKTAATHATQFGLGGMEIMAFRGMCLAFHISDNPDEIVEELAEKGILEEWSMVDNAKQTLKQIAGGNVEDKEVRAGFHKGEEHKRRAEEDLQKERETIEWYQNDPRYQTDPEFKQKWDAWRNKVEKEKTHVRYSLGFQRFIDQYHVGGFPLRFTEDE